MNMDINKNEHHVNIDRAFLDKEKVGYTDLATILATALISDTGCG
jgi:hypothetical protein